MKFLNSLAKETLKRKHYFITDIFFDDLEVFIKDLIAKEVRTHEEGRKLLQAKAKTAEFVIEKIVYYYDQSIIKKSQKTLMTRAEFKWFCENTSEEEQSKVQEWLKDSGGNSKYIREDSFLKD